MCDMKMKMTFSGNRTPRVVVVKDVCSTHSLRGDKNPKEIRDVVSMGKRKKQNNDLIANGTYSGHQSTLRSVLGMSASMSQ